MRKVFLILGLCALGLAAYVQAQPGGGGRMGGMSMMRGGVESDWAMICFDLEVDGETMVKLRPMFKQAWNDRKELIKDVRSGDVDWTMMMEEMAAIQQDLEKEYNEILSEGQRKKLAELKAAQQGAWQRGGQRGGTQGGQRGGGR
ncbi:MAG: hypothetical protein HOC74_09425 [Gemmatimonadetes bacterium]|jgi:hypothetical protein|nr:hypothetical protein [Gemmatimonadota bacterium]